MNMLTTALGAGEFRLVESSTRKVYRGEPVEPEHLIAIADFGPLSIEEIQPVRGESVYTEFLAKHGEGVHHLGFKLGSAKEYALALDRLTAAGLPSPQSGSR